MSQRVAKLTSFGCLLAARVRDYARKSQTHTGHPCLRENVRHQLQHMSSGFSKLNDFARLSRMRVSSFRRTTSPC